MHSKCTREDPSLDWRAFEVSHDFWPCGRTSPASLPNSRPTRDRKSIGCKPTQTRHPHNIGRDGHHSLHRKLYATMARLRSGNAAPTPSRPAATGRTILREKTNTTTGTPGPAVETSMLALKNFKRRPRQGSMLEMVRKRRSSVQASLISAQPQQDDGEDVEDTSVFDLGSASEGEDVFAPQAEGTPLQPSKTRKSTSAQKSLSAKKSVATTPAVKRTKRKSDEMESPHSALDALRRKHRKSEVMPAEEEPLPSIDDAHQSVVHGTSDHEASPVPNAVTSDVQVINSSPESTPPTEPSSSRKIPGTQEEDFAVPSTEEQERLHTLQQDAQEEEQDEEEEEDDHDTLNATMAEPASSSPTGSPIPETQRTDIYADPLTQLSPPPPEPTKTRSKTTKKPTAMSTATLRALLPKRTLRPQPRPKRTEYDISSDEEDEDATAFDTTHLDDDEDELGGRIRRHKKKAPATSKAKKATSKSKSKQSLSTRKSSAPPPPAKSKGGSKAKAKGKTTRTYGRAAATSDKENDEALSEDDDENDHAGDMSLSMREVGHSKELEEARRKFAEVDNWDLTFESMSNEDHRSSSQGWR